MFSGIMNATRFGTVCEAGLLPFIQERFPDGHRLYQVIQIHCKVFGGERGKLVVHTTRIT